MKGSRWPLLLGRVEVPATLPACPRSLGLDRWGQRDYLRASVFQNQAEGYNHQCLKFSIFHIWSVCTTTGRTNPLRGKEFSLKVSRSGGKSSRSGGSGGRPGQKLKAILWLTERKREREGVAGARWQQWHVSATWPGEYEPFSPLLFSQCEMTLAHLSACLANRFSVCPSIRLAVCHSDC